MLQGAVAVTAAEARVFDGYALNEANAHAIAISVSNLYSLAEENATCDWDIESVEECTAVIAISMGAAWTPTSINSQHFPAGCFLATAIDDKAAFFNFHSNAVNTDKHSHQSVCRTGALLSDVSAASFCETTSAEVAATSEEDCVTSCAVDASCKGIKYNRGSSKCELLGTQTLSFIGNSSNSLHCIKTASCLRSDLAVIDDVVSLDSCFQNPRLNPSLDAQNACFDIGCGAKRKFLRNCTTVDFSRFHVISIFSCRRQYFKIPWKYLVNRYLRPKRTCNSVSRTVVQLLRMHNQLWPGETISDIRRHHSCDQWRYRMCR